MAAGFARGASKRRKRIAFGDERRIIWDQFSEMIFRGNPNVAPPGTEQSGGLEWIPFYKGHRLYNRQGPDKWIWNYEFKAVAGEVFLSREEKKFAEGFGRDFVVIEPNVPTFKSVAPNKQWPVDRYDRVALELRRAGREVIQFSYGQGHMLAAARQVKTPNFRYAMAILARAGLYIGPEGGMHHGAAALGKPAVVLFGGFIPPAVTGYDLHTNLTGGAEACGMLKPCAHCRAAMEKILVEEVLVAAAEHLNKVVA